MGDLLGIHEVIRNGEKIGSLTVTQDGLMTRFMCEIEIRIDDVLRLAGVSGGKYVRLGVLAPDGGKLVLKKSVTKSTLRSLKLEPEAGFFAVLQNEEYDGKGTGEEKEEIESEEGAGKEKTPERIRAEERTYRLSDVVEKTAESAPHDIEHGSGEKKPPKIPKETEVQEKISGTADKKAESPPDRREWTPIADPSVLFDDEDIAGACKDAKGALTMEKDGITLLAIPVIPGEPFPMMPVFCFGDSMMIDGREYIIFKSKNGNFTV